MCPRWACNRGSDLMTAIKALWPGFQLNQRGHLS
jgi:hypothetical protein